MGPGGGPGESGGCMEAAFFRGKGKRSAKQARCNEWDIQAGKGITGGLHVTRGRENLQGVNRATSAELYTGL